MDSAIVPAELAIPQAEMAAGARILNLTRKEEDFLTRPRLRTSIMVEGYAAGAVDYAELYFAKFWPSPSRGGSRLVVADSGLDVTEAETEGLAASMGPKHALWYDSELGPLHGGAKIGLKIPAGATPAEITNFWRWAIVALADEIGSGGHIVAPDIGTDSLRIAQAMDVIALLPGRGAEFAAFAAKLPRSGGRVTRIPATGLGGAIAAAMAWERRGSTIAGRSVAIPGFGIAGQWAAHYAVEAEARVVMASDITGGVLNDSRECLDVEALIKHVAAGGPIGEFKGGEPVPRNAVLTTPVDTIIFAGPGGLVASRDEIRAIAAIDPARAAETVAAEDVRCQMGVGITNAPAFPGGVKVLRESGIEWIGYLTGGGLGAYASQQEILGFDPETILEKLETKAKHVNTTVADAANHWRVPFDRAEWAVGMSTQIQHARDCGKV